MTYPPKPQPTTIDSALSYGLRLFTYLLSGHVDGAEVYGMLNRDELELAHHASQSPLVYGAHATAIDTIATVRLRIARSVNALIAESNARIDASIRAETPIEETQPPEPTADELIARFARALIALANKPNDNPRDGGSRVLRPVAPKPQPPANTAADTIRF